MVSLCLPSDALLEHLPSYLGFSYLGYGVSLHSCPQQSAAAAPYLEAQRVNPTSKERWLRGCRRAERSYSMFKVRRGDLVQGKE